MGEQTLDRLIRVGLKAVVVGVALVAIVYFLDRPGTARSLVDRQIAAGETAVRQYPTNVGMRLQLAEVYRTANRQASAPEQYGAVLKVEQNQTALLGRGEILSEQGELSGARKAFEQVLGKART